MMVPKTIIFIGLLFFLVTALQADDNCMTAECHTQLKAVKKLHFPAQDNCSRCHETKGKVSDHKFTVVNQTEVCFNCHDENRNRKHVHDAITASDCVSCHNPHGGNYKDYLKMEHINTLCFECHDKESMSKKVVHAPLQSGDCTQCHKAHSSDYPALLVAKKEGICITCHEDMDLARKKELKVHSVLQEGCSGCHSPHSSDHRSLLLEAPLRICGTCHEDIAEKAGTAKVKHPILEQRKGCMNCHDPHASKEDCNLEKVEKDLCVNCHNKPLPNTKEYGYNIRTIMRKNPDRHEPFAEGKCSDCHDPHGSDFFRILNAPYPARFYSEFNVNNYKLCFQCHDSALAETKETTAATNFREGSQNLHYLHVNLQKGRTCRACHEVHAGKNKKLVREKVSFGKWDLPLNFTKTDSGGSCTPGCHKTYTYNREIKSQPLNKRINQ